MRPLTIALLALLPLTASAELGGWSRGWLAINLYRILIAADDPELVADFQTLHDLAYEGASFMELVWAVPNGTVLGWYFTNYNSLAEAGDNDPDETLLTAIRYALIFYSYRQ